PLIWILPLLLTAVFGVASVVAEAFSPGLLLLVLVYTALPLACVYSLGQRTKVPHLLDFAAIVLLWFPLEFAAGQALVPRPAQGFLHSVAYGIAILLALVMFLGYRQIPGMKYRFPVSLRDLRLPLIAFALTAPVLAVLGIAIGFIPPLHFPTQSGGRMAAA